MGDIIGGLLLLGVLFGLEIIAIFILIMSAVYGRQLVFVILCGVVAAVVMAAEAFAPQSPALARDHEEAAHA